jgi:hypothetical protein
VFICGKVKVNAVPLLAKQAQSGGWSTAPHILDPALQELGLSAPHPGRFTVNLLRILQEAGWAHGTRCEWGP